MKLLIDREELTRGLTRIAGICGKDSLAFALLKAEGEVLTLTGTDTELAFTAKAAANIQKPGALAVDAKNLLQIVRVLPSANVQLTALAGNKLEVRSGASVMKIPGIPATEYTGTPDLTPTGKVIVNGDELCRLIDQTSFAIATDINRSGLNGAHMERVAHDGGFRLRMVATDGHRLGVADCKFEGDLTLTPRMLLPRKALAVIRKFVEGDEAIAMEFGQGAIRISRAGQTFWFRLLEGEFPDYRAVVPASGKHKATMKCEPFAAMLRRAAVVVGDRARPVKFNLRGSGLDVSVTSADRGDFDEQFSTESTEGGDILFGLNSSFLADIIGAIPEAEFTMELQHPVAPCKVYGVGTDAAFFILMPMRLD